MDSKINTIQGKDKDNKYTLNNISPIKKFKGYSVNKDYNKKLVDKFLFDTLQSNNEHKVIIKILERKKREIDLLKVMKFTSEISDTNINNHDNKSIIDEVIPIIKNKSTKKIILDDENMLYFNYKNDSPEVVNNLDSKNKNDNEAIQRNFDLKENLLNTDLTTLVNINSTNNTFE